MVHHHCLPCIRFSTIPTRTPFIWQNKMDFGWSKRHGIIGLVGYDHARCSDDRICSTPGQKIGKKVR